MELQRMEQIIYVLKKAQRGEPIPADDLKKALEAMEDEASKKYAKIYDAQDLDKAIKGVLKRAKKNKMLEGIHEAFYGENGHVYVTDSYMALEITDASHIRLDVRPKEGNLNIEKACIDNTSYSCYIPRLKDVERHIKQAKARGLKSAFTLQRGEPNASIKSAIDCEMLRLAMIATGSDEIHFQYKDSIRPFHFYSDDKNVHALVLPMRIFGNIYENDDGFIMIDKD